MKTKKIDVPLIPTVVRHASIIHLPGTRLTPEVLLRQFLNKIDNIESVVILCQDKKGMFESSWSQMTLRELSFALLTFDEDVRKAMYKQEQEDENSK